MRRCGCGKGIVVCSCSATTFNHHSPRKGGGAMPAQRASGMDQEVSPWSPIIARPVLRWPDNARVAAGSQPVGRPRGAVEREPAGVSRYRRLWQSRVRQSRRPLSYPRRPGQVRHHADPGARQGRRRPLSIPDPGGAAARRGVHRARPLAPAPHPHRHVRGRGAAVYPRRDRGGRTGHRHAPGGLVRPRLPGDAAHPRPARCGRHPLRL